jgi:hypothetical protein
MFKFVFSPVQAFGNGCERKDVRSQVPDTAEYLRFQVPDLAEYLRPIHLHSTSAQDEATLSGSADVIPMTDIFAFPDLLPTSLMASPERES